MSEQDTAGVPRSQQAQGLRDHYESVSMRASDWCNQIPIAIDLWEHWPDLEAENARLQKTIKGMQREHDRLIKMGREVETENARLQAEARYCNQCRSADEIPLNNVIYLCFWCEDSFCFEHAAKHFGSEHGGREDLTRERDGYKAQLEIMVAKLEVLGYCGSDVKEARAVLEKK